MIHEAHFELQSFLVWMTIFSVSLTNIFLVAKSILFFFASIIFLLVIWGYWFNYLISCFCRWCFFFDYILASVFFSLSYKHYHDVSYLVRWSCLSKLTLLKVHGFRMIPFLINTFFFLTQLRHSSPHHSSFLNQLSARFHV